MNDVTAILLCGGKGTRLRPFTESMPKALVPLRGEPLLHHLMRYLADAGVRRFVLCVGHLAEQIERFVAERCDPAWNVVCVNSGDASMTDRILDAQAHVTGQALICYGDTLSNVDLVEQSRQHQASGAALTLTVHPLHSPFGIVQIADNGRVTGFSEKPRLPHWINIGFMRADPAAFKFLRRGGDMVSFLDALASAGQMNAFRHEGRHLTVNTERERDEAEAQLADFYTLPNEIPS